MAADYPVKVLIAPTAPQSRLTVFFRILMVIPHAIVLNFLQIAQLVVTVLAWFSIVIVGKYPSGMYGFSTGMLRWTARVGGYGGLLTGAYPPFSLDDDDYPVRFVVEPALTGRNRITTFFRMFMIIPHVVVLYFVMLFVGLITFLAWFAALFSGRVPAGMHGLMAGGLRWQIRLGAYQMLLTDAYPPFSME